MDWRRGENSKYFLSLEKHNQSSNNIKEIKTKDGLKMNKANAILGEMLNFYEELYTSKNIQNEKIESYLSEISESPKLDYDDAQ